MTSTLINEQTLKIGGQTDNSFTNSKGFKVSFGSTSSPDWKPFGEEGGAYQAVQKQFSLKGSVFDIEGSQFMKFANMPSKAFGESLAAGTSKTVSGSANIFSIEPMFTSMSGGGGSAYSFVKPINDLGGLLGGGGAHRS